MIFYYLTNIFAFPEETVTGLYRCLAEICFKSIKQHLLIDFSYRFFRGCREKPDKSNIFRLRTGCYHQEATHTEYRSLHRVTELEPHSAQERTIATTANK
jgi:hypothetical protein